MTEEKEKIDVLDPLTDFTRHNPIKATYLDRGKKVKEKAKTCLELDLKYTFEDAIKAAWDMGLRNQAGNKMSHQAIRRLSTTFIVTYPDEARKVYQEVLGEYPNTPEGDAGWIYTLVSIAIRFFGRKDEFIRWSVQNGVYKKGFNLFYKHYHIDENDKNAFDDILGE